MSPIDLHGRMLITIGGARRDRTDDLLNANQALFQLSYGPAKQCNQSLVRSNADGSEEQICVLQNLFCVIRTGTSNLDIL